MSDVLGPCARCELRSGHHVRYLDQGSGPALVFIHGLPGQATDFLPLIETLRGDYRCIAYDRIGYGGSHSPRHQHSRTIDHNADELIELLDALGIAQAVLVGWSFGAHIAFDAAAAHADRVRAVILLGGAGPSFDWPKGAVDRLLFQSGFGSLVLKLMRRFGADAFRSSLDDAYGGKMPDALVQSFHQSLFVPGMIETWIREGRRWDPSSSNAQHVEQPILILHGEADSRVPISVAEDLYQIAKHAQFEALAQVGHWPFASHPDLVAEKCRTFVEALAQN